MIYGEAIVVEDSDTQGRLISRLIEREQWRATPCKSLQAAYHYMKTTFVNLVFLDVYLGEINTLSEIPKIKGMSPKSVLAVMTAGTQEEAIEATLKAARESEADYVLKKPFDTRAVRAIVGEVSKDHKLGRRRPHALVVDDCNTVRHLVIGVLADNGYRVSEARSMEEALANANIAHVDLVVTDIFMPGMGGIEGTKIIKTTWPKVKVLAMSAGLEDRMPREKALMAAREIGADAQLKKPFQSNELLEMTEALVG
jgi:DNA-binding response OmpR family regulator